MRPRVAAGGIAKIPYTVEFFNLGTEDAFYCSLLIWRAYYNYGVDLMSRQSIVSQINQRKWLLNIVSPTIAAFRYVGVLLPTPDDIAMSPNVTVVSAATNLLTRTKLIRTIILHFSPVVPYLTGPNGQAVGVDPATNQEVNTVPGAIYGGSESEPKLISVPDLSGSWKMQLTGTDTGPYTLFIASGNSDQQVAILKGTTAPGVKAVYDIDRPDDGTLTVAPEDQLPPTTSLVIYANQGANGWLVSTAVVTLTAIDNPLPPIGVGVSQTEYSLDAGATWQSYTEPFTLSDGIHTILYRSTDYVGNVEPTKSETIKVDTVPPVVSMHTDQDQYLRTQPFIAHFSAYDPQPGSGMWDTNASFNNQPVTDGQSIDLFMLDLGSYTLSVTARDQAGWITTQKATIQLIATLQGLRASVERMCAEQQITDHGTCNSLLQKLDAALAAHNRGNSQAESGLLQAFQNEVTAQNGKKIPPTEAHILIEDGTYVLQHLQVPSPTTPPTTTTAPTFIPKK